MRRINDLTSLADFMRRINELTSLADFMRLMTGPL